MRSARSPKILNVAQFVKTLASFNVGIDSSCLSFLCQAEGLLSRGRVQALSGALLTSHNHFDGSDRWLEE